VFGSLYSIFFSWLDGKDLPMSIQQRQARALIRRVELEYQSQRVAYLKQFRNSLFKGFAAAQLGGWFDSQRSIFSAVSNRNIRQVLQYAGGAGFSLVFLRECITVRIALYNLSKAKQEAVTALSEQYGLSVELGTEQFDDELYDGVDLGSLSDEEISSKQVDN
jgi:hypothetical protein